MVAKMAERYDGDPAVAFFAIGAYGMWGEGHTVRTTPTHGHSWGFESQKRIIDIYTRHFRKTQLCISDDYAGHDDRRARFPIIDYAKSKGVTIKDDSILVMNPPDSWYHSGMAQIFWPEMPVILEHEHYGISVKFDAWDADLLLKAVEDYHASLLSIARVFTDSFGSFSRACPSGKAGIYFSVGTAYGSPTISLPYKGDDGHKRYYLGEVTLK